MSTPPRLLLCAALTALVLAAPAGASQVSYDGPVLHYTAAAGEQNSVLITVNPYDNLCQPVAAPCLSLSDSARISFPAGRCVLNSSDVFGDRLYCEAPTSIVADLGDGDDAMWDWDGPSVIDAGTGNDNPIEGAGGDDVIQGGVGNDNLIGGRGDDAIDGGPGDDDLEGIPGGHEGAVATLGRDTYRGGGGYDSLTYEDRGENLNLSPDGVADDGAAGEGDNIGEDITTIVGGDGSDTMTGNARRNVFAGNAGDDVLTGGDGDDNLGGGTGNDRLTGGAGADVLGGDDGDDVIDGGPDVDRIWGENPSGCIPLSCPSGQDEIHARDGLAEQIDCGPGIDAADVDAVDVLSAGSCENVAAAGSSTAAPAGTSPPGGAASGTSALSIAGATADRRGRIALRVTVPGPGRLGVTATARAAKRTIRVARTARTLDKPGAVRLTLRASKKARRALRKRRTLPASLVVSFRPAGGGRAITRRQAIMLRR